MADLIIFDHNENKIAMLTYAVSYREYKSYIADLIRGTIHTHLRLAQDQLNQNTNTGALKCVPHSPQYLQAL